MWMPTYQNAYWYPQATSDELYHYGILGMRWGIRRYQNPNGTLTTVGRNRYSKNKTKLADKPPRKELRNGDYLYSKGTIVGRFGSDNNWNQEKDVTYVYTNEKDRSHYSKGYGNNEIIYRFKKDVKMPNLQKQYTDLLEFVSNNKNIKDKYDYAYNEPFDFWKDYVNQGGKTADQYYSYMKNKGYDALIDFRNVGLAEDPIIILSPKNSLKLKTIGGKSK